MTKELTTNQTKELLNELPLEIIYERLKKKFKYCVGKENSIDVQELFGCVYKEITVNKYQFSYLMTRILRAINLLKKKTNYFIVGEYDDNRNYSWYILQNEDELERYRTSINDRITGLRAMETAAMKHVMMRMWKRLE